MDSQVCLRLHWIKALPVFSRIHKLRFSRARTMNPARHRFVALHDLEELVRMKARHAEVRLLAHGAVDTGNYSNSFATC